MDYIRRTLAKKPKCYKKNVIESSHSLFKKHVFAYEDDDWVTRFVEKLGIKQNNVTIHEGQIGTYLIYTIY